MPSNTNLKTCQPDFSAILHQRFCSQRVFRKQLANATQSVSATCRSSPLFLPALRCSPNDRTRQSIGNACLATFPSIRPHCLLARSSNLLSLSIRPVPYMSVTDGRPTLQSLPTASPIHLPKPGVRVWLHSLFHRPAPSRILRRTSYSHPFLDVQVEPLTPRFKNLVN